MAIFQICPMSKLVLLCLLINNAFAVWPQPSEYTNGDSVLWLSPNVHFIHSSINSSAFWHGLRRYSMYVGAGNVFDFLQSQFFYSRDSYESQPVNPSVDSLVQAAIQRTQNTLESSQFVPWKFHPRNSDFEPTLNGSGTQITQIYIHQPLNGSETGSSIKSYLDQDETYTLDISEAGQVNINANSTIGTIRALDTLTQLFYAHSSGAGTYTPYAPISITDAPKWRHRGLNLDIARNVFSPRDVMRTIDAMSTCKLNRLHIHATDAQSWPLYIPSLPQLSNAGAYRSYLAWSPSDLQQVQLYGLYRGISVFIEIDMPGHTASIAHAFPSLITAFNKEDWSTYAAEPPSGELKLNSSAVYKFIDTLFADILPRVSPYTSYFHTGGDEVNVNAYLLDETVQSNSTSVLQPLLQALINHLHTLVRAQNLTPIVWEEMLLDWNLTFPSSTSSSTNSSTTNTTVFSSASDVIVQTWQSPATLLEVLQRGHRALFGDYTHWYLDCGQGIFLNPYNTTNLTSPLTGAATQVVDPYVDYCSPVKNWRHIYTYNPLTNITTDLEYLIEGGEAHMWTEQTDPVSLDRMVWPRATAAAELLWSGPREASQLVDATQRLGEWRERVVIDHGVQSAVVEMIWCLMGEGNCEL